MILGSSHISNLHAYLRTNFDMNLASHEIRIKGFRGGMVYKMYTALVDVNNFKPNTVILQIGSNDISDRKTSSSSSSSSSSNAVQSSTIEYYGNIALTGCDNKGAKSIYMCKLKTDGAIMGCCSSVPPA